MKKMNITAMMTRLLACVLLLATAAVSLASCEVKEKAGEAWETVKDGATDIYDEVKEKITVEQIDELGEISLVSLYTGTETVDEQDVVVQVISATVLPETTVNRATTWDVYWMDNQTGDEDADVTDYVTVMACSESAPYTRQDGSNFCKITCKQAFGTSTIGVRVTTVVGGYTAECEVKYEGRPSYLGIHRVLDEGGYELVTKEISLNSNTRYSFKLVPDNVLHSVGEKFNEFEIVSQGYDPDVTIVVKQGYYKNGEWQDDATTGEMKISELPGGLGFYTPVLTLEGDTLTIVTNYSVTEYIYDKVYGGTSTYRFAYASGMEPTYWIKVRDTVSGIESTLAINVKAIARTVSLSDTALMF